MLVKLVAELKAKLDAGAPVVLLDVRTAPEREQTQLHDPRVVWIPLGQLRKRVAELPRDKEIVLQSQPARLRRATDSGW